MAILKHWNLTYTSLIRILGASIFIGAFFFCDWLLIIHENGYDAAMMFGIMLLLFRLREFPMILTTHFVGFRILDEITLDDNRIDIYDYIQIITVLVMTFFSCWYKLKGNEFKIKEGNIYRQ